MTLIDPQMGVSREHSCKRQLAASWIFVYKNKHIFMWLPVANIFSAILGKIQQNMLKIDLSQIAAQGDTFFSPYDAAYLVFMVIGIVGYFTVLNVAGYIVNAGGGNAMLQKVNALVISGGGQFGLSRGFGHIQWRRLLRRGHVRGRLRGHAPAGSAAVRPWIMMRGTISKISFPGKEVSHKPFSAIAQYRFGFPDG